ncbi:nitric oxide synthase-interacting protein [Eudromia elegans]
MTRHGKNCTAGAVYTYHEKRKDTAASGYGTQRVRLGRDAVKDFDCCCLSLQPCRDPVVTPDGFLFEREAILEYLLHERRRIQRLTKAYERQRAERRRAREQQQREGAQAALRGFLQSGGAPGAAPSTSGDAEPQTLPSFWIPSLTPEAEAGQLPKPDPVVRCPMSGRPLRRRDLVPVRFSAPPGPTAPGTGPGPRGERWVCALSGDALGNAVPCAVLRPSGAVVTLACVERLIRKDMRDPLSGTPLGEGDIIVLQRGGTGFAGSGVCLEAKKSRRGASQRAVKVGVVYWPRRRPEGRGRSQDPPPSLDKYSGFGDPLMRLGGVSMT